MTQDYTYNPDNDISYIGHDQSFGPKSPPTPRLGPPGSALPRPLPRPPDPAAPPEGPDGRALPQRLHTPRNAKFTLEQLQPKRNTKQGKKQQKQNYLLLKQFKENVS